MTRPAAPLEKAVELAKKSLAFHTRTGCCRCDACAAITALLAALDADRGEAEAALRRIEAQETAVDGLRPELYGHAVAIARRYFARREEKGENRESER